MSKKRKKLTMPFPPITEQPLSRPDLLAMLADVLEWVAGKLRELARS